MSHSTLYRKIRPKTFTEVVGQPHIVQTLQNQLASGHIGHAYLFCGTRGTGKTSVARIFSRAVNCIALEGGNPCNLCDSCQNILHERSMDNIEIDAASNNGVENIRDLREEVKFLPTQGKYKVYIVDEVHMLSASAFNALLKTLEEPPAHVIFIMATTDVQKVPGTILSRVQRYDFRRIAKAQMGELIAGHLKSENIPYEDEAIDYIAEHSDGAMRDALSLLDQCISDENGLTLLGVREMLGAVERGRLFDFTDALVEKNAAAVLSIISQAHGEGRDYVQLAEDLIRHFRNVLVVGLCGGGDFSKSYGELLASQAKKTGTGLLMEYIGGFSEAVRDMRYASHMRTAFEVCALGFCTRGARSKLEPESTGKQSGAKKASSNIQADSGTAPAPHEQFQTTSRDLASFTECFAEFLGTLSGLLKPSASKSTVRVDGTAVTFLCDSESTANTLKSRQAALGEAIAKFFGLEQPPELAFLLQSGYNTEQTKSNDQWQGFTKVDNPQNIF